MVWSVFDSKWKYNNVGGWTSDCVVLTFYAISDNICFNSAEIFIHEIGMASFRNAASPSFDIQFNTINMFAVTCESVSYVKLISLITF